MTSYCSLLYLGIFLPCVVLAYMAVPAKWRWSVLLAASYAFFWELSGKLLCYLLFTTVSVYLAALRLTALGAKRDERLAQLKKSGKEELRAAKKEIKTSYQRRQRRTLILTAVVQLGILAVLKYSVFFCDNINRLSGVLHLPVTFSVPSFVLPIGISFYTLQAISYLTDVYRGTVEADRNLGRVALYMAFFPQIMEGPICRYGQTAAQLWEGRPITYRNLSFGLQRIGFGLLKKMVIADRLNPLIETVYTDFAMYDGGIMAVGMFLYTCQLYMDFSGTMDMAIGSAEIFGVAMPENFRRPFLSRTISKFWTRWHITLGTWFKDYVFYPLSVSKAFGGLTVRARKQLGNHFGPLVPASIALFAVWIGNGLWHGAGWHYIFFGMYHFAWILFENITEPFVRQFAQRHHIDRESIPYRTMQIIRTILLVNVGELFFRAESLRAGFVMFQKMITEFSLSSLRDGTILNLGMDAQDFVIAAVAVVIVAVVHILSERGISVREELSRKHTAFRWAVYYGLILFVMIFGAYGMGYVPVDPIYAGF